MSKILKSLRQLRKEVGETNRTSAYGTRFVNDFYEVVLNLSNGKPIERTGNNWAFGECSFADKRMNTFVFRQKFLKRMSSFDKELMNFVANEVMRDIRAEILAPNNTSEEHLLIGTVTMCRTIQGLGEL